MANDHPPRLHAPEDPFDPAEGDPAQAVFPNGPEPWWRRNVQVFLEHHFAPFMVHAIFQLMAILLAFLLAGLWENYKGSIKDAGSRWIIFRSVNSEISDLRRELTALQATVQRVSGPRCTAMVLAKKFETPVWDSLILNDRYLLLTEPPREKLWNAYADLKQHEMSMGCKGFVDAMVATFAGLEKETATAQAQAKQDWSQGSLVFTWAEVGLALFGSLVLLVFLLPMLSKRSRRDAERAVIVVPGAARR